MSKTKTSKRKNSHRVPTYRRPWMVIIFFLAMAAAVVLVLLFLKPRSNDEPKSTPTATTQTPTTNNPNPAVPEEETTPPEDSAEPEKTTQYEGEDPNTLGTLTGYLTRKGVDDGELTIVAVIDQYLHSSGYCTVTLKNSAGQTVYSASRSATPDATTSICDTFEIPVTNLASGKYQIEINLSGDNKQGKIIDEVELWVSKVQSTICASIVV